VREKIRNLVESKAFENFILAVIIVNAIVIGVQTTHPEGGLAQGLAIFDIVCLGIYIVEAILKIIAYGGGYFRKDDLFEAFGDQPEDVMKRYAVVRVDDGEPSPAGTDIKIYDEEGENVLFTLVYYQK
jgi:hypothetical protein